jgi:hypothetical protein
VRVQDPQDSRLTKDQYPRPRRRAPVGWHNRQPHPSFNGAPHLFSPLAPARLARHWLTTSRKFGSDHLKLNQKKHLSGGLSRRPKRRAQAATNGRPGQQPHWLLQSHEPPGSPSARSNRRPGGLDRLDCFDLILAAREATEWEMAKSDRRVTVEPVNKGAPVSTRDRKKPRQSLESAGPRSRGEPEKAAKRSPGDPSRPPAIAPGFSNNKNSMPLVAARAKKHGQFELRGALRADFRISRRMLSRSVRPKWTRPSGGPKEASADPAGVFFWAMLAGMEPDDRPCPEMVTHRLEKAGRSAAYGFWSRRRPVTRG